MSDFIADCNATRAAFLRGESPTAAVDALIDTFKTMPGNECGGALHIVTDDSNLDDDSIDWCIDHARKEGDAAAEALGMLLRAMTLRQRVDVEALNCPCGCVNEYREQLGMPLVEPGIIVEWGEDGSVMVRPRVAPEPPDGGWATYVVDGIESGNITLKRRPP